MSASVWTATLFYKVVKKKGLQLSASESNKAKRKPLAEPLPVLPPLPSLAQADDSADAERHLVMVGIKLLSNRNRLATIGAAKLLGTAAVLMSGSVCIDICIDMRIDMYIDICIDMCMCGADEWQRAIDKSI